MTNYVLYYTVLLSMMTFLICGFDKLAAKAGWRRVPEKTFFILSFIGGAVGMTCGIFFFHHKTKHFWFVTAIPTAAAVQLALLAWLGGIFPGGAPWSLL